MTWRLESSFGGGAGDLLVIQPVTDDDPTSEVRHVRIRVTPGGNRWMPAIPHWTDGHVYVDRNKIPYTIITSETIEFGRPDGENSILIYDYLAAIGRHTILGMSMKGLT
jgi:hypothetical protein